MEYSLISLTWLFFILIKQRSSLLIAFTIRLQESSVLKVLLEAFKYLSPEEIDPEEYDIQEDLLRVGQLLRMQNYT